MAKTSVLRAGLVAMAAVALMLVPTAALAAEKADLLAKPGPVPSKLGPNDGLAASDKTRNKGDRVARRSKTGYYLSVGDKWSDDAVALGKRGVKKLAPKERSRGERQLIVPAGTPSGTYFLLACADINKKVAEKKENNNCRASAPIDVAAASGPPDGDGGGGGDVPPDGGGGDVPPDGGEPPPEYPPGYFPRPVDPIAVSPVLEEDRSVTQTIFTFGGTITATASDGTVFTLTLPQNALLSSTDITLTPVASIGGLPLSNGLVAAVQIEPEGLELQKPATLTIEPPTEAPISEQTGFIFHGSGGDFHLYPLGMTRTLSMELTHFSTPGVGLGTGADREAVIAQMPARTRAQYEQTMSELVRSERAAQLLGEPGNPDFANQLANLVLRYFDDVVRPELIAAESDDALARQAIAEALSWARQAELLGLGDDPSYQLRWEEALERIQRILTNATDKAYTRCVEDHELDDIITLISLERIAQLLGLDIGDPLDKLRKCARFEVVFDSTITAQQSWSTEWPDEGTRAYDLDALFHVRSEDLIIDWTGLGSGPLGWATFSWESVNTFPCGGGGSLQSHVRGIATAAGDMQAALRLDLNPRETPPGEPAPPPPESVLDLFLRDRPDETYESWNDGCTSSSPDTQTDSRWYFNFAAFHENSSRLTIPIPLDGQVGDLIVSEAYDQSAGTGGMESARVTEDTTVELWHRPEPGG